MSRRVVITGAGVVSPIGIGVHDFWRQCLQAKSVVTPIPGSWRRYGDFHSQVWSPLPDIDPESFGVSRTERLQYDPITVLVVGAAREALNSAGFSLTPAGDRGRHFALSGVDASRIGVYVGTGVGGAYTFLHNHTYHLHQRLRASLKAYAEECAPIQGRDRLEDILALMAHGPRYNPFVVSMLMPNAPAAALGIKFSLTGPNLTYCIACASGTVAVGNAFRAVRDGSVEVAVTGGGEYLYDEHGHIFRGFDAAGTLVHDYADPETANRPFDKDHAGFLFSQGGAAILILEELEHARRRGVVPITEVVGFAETFDAHSMMSLAPGGEQIERMIRAALADADLTPQDIDYINAHGTGTKNNDRTEAEVIDRVFGKSVRVNTTKSLIGHTIGASGAIEVLVTALSLRDGVTHICKNLNSPVADLNFVCDTRRFDPLAGLSQSFAFGGHNAAVVMRRFD